MRVSQSQRHVGQSIRLSFEAKNICMRSDAGRNQPSRMMRGDPWMGLFQQCGTSTHWIPVSAEDHSSRLLSALYHYPIRRYYWLRTPLYLLHSPEYLLPTWRGKEKGRKGGRQGMLDPYLGYAQGCLARDGPIPLLWNRKHQNFEAPRGATLGMPKAIRLLASPTGVGL
ncbi:hypothetical protein BO71DRAFT_400944 [Aspergillus ellipticus CBS 707.79]|uniref:Uncharacterized protein n=1 Tax=Aspergillus ellipticus CBS 707.79 TaxID=1448320 RepID=A0A319D459_9EURO|nr:hypothetical protein BO71DRAFT_400944 [Aspergillus ellipticus CBS 707.79]